MSRINNRTVSVKDRAEGKFGRKKKSYMYDYSVPKNKVEIDVSEARYKEKETTTTSVFATYERCSLFAY